MNSPLSVSLFLSAIIWIALLTPFVPRVSAQPPTDAPSAPTREEEVIRRSLENPSAIIDSGDPILDDLLQIIQRRGSLLDGSSLDISDSLSSKAETTNPESNSPPRAIYVAETLLRNARLLERLDPHSKPRLELVHQMRLEALRLMQQSIAAEADPRESWQKQ